MPLRARLIVVTLVLLATALAVIGTASVLILRACLLHDADTQLAAQLDSGTVPPRLPGDFVLQLRGPDGGLKQDVRSSGAPGPAIPDDPGWLAAQRNQPVTTGTWRVLVDAPRPDGDTLVVAMDLGGVNHTIRLLTAIEAIVGAVTAAGLAVVGVVAVRRSLRPLAELEHAAAAIVAGSLERVPARGEFSTLAASLNTMLTRLESARAESEARMRRFLTDASHELRTPLSIIRGQAEFWGRRGGGDPAALVTALHRVEDEAIRMGVLVDDLLLLARLDHDRLTTAPVDLLALAGDAVHAARLSAPARDIRLVAADAAFLVPGDPVRLRQVLDNLLANALTHTPQGTPVEVRLRAGDRHAVLEVADRGPGLTPEQATHVFDRFYRVDVARGRNTGGTGLGLAIVAALVTAHGGVVEVDAAPGAGATFRVALPLAAMP